MYHRVDINVFPRHASGANQTILPFFHSSHWNKHHRFAVLHADAVDSQGRAGAESAASQGPHIHSSPSQSSTSTQLIMEGMRQNTYM
jgi:hypothetical protein